MEDYRSRKTTMKELLDNQELVNGTICTEDGGVFRVHMEILYGYCPYFRRILSATRNTDQGSILIPGTSKETIANIINYLYTGQLHLALDKVNILAQTAEFLEMPDIIQLCRKFLSSKLNEENCLAIYSFARHFQYADLKEEARHYAMAHFQQIFPMSSDFLNLEVEDVVAMLGNDSLNVKDEENVFWALMRWVEKEPDIRVAYLASLLRCVRFGLISSEFYEQIICLNPLVSINDECRSVIVQAAQVFEDVSLQNSNSDFRQSIMLDMRHPFLRPRMPNEVIFVMGGWSNGSATNVIETYDVNSGRWFLSLVTDSVPRAYHGMVWHKGYIYIIGGFDGNQCFNSVRRFNPITHIWEEKGCMFSQRCYVSVATVGDYIYAMGGYDGHRRNKTCERYDPTTNQWTLVAQMNQVRSDASADSLNEKVYIAGGFNGQQVLNSAEFYDPVTNEWTLITAMNSPRSGVKLVAYRDCLYIIGGFNGNNRLASVEKYDPRTRMWIAVPAMRGPRSNFAASVLNGYLYVIGGFNGLSTISNVERFDSIRNLWSVVTDLNLNRSALAACTVSGIPNTYEYTYLGNVPY